jgi:SAM-dependent methyltransferase
MYNKVFNLQDFEIFNKILLENQWNCFPPQHQWEHSTHVCKVVSLLEIVKQFDKPQKIVDIGSAAGAFPHLAQKMGHDVTAIDLEGYKYFSQLGTNALSKLITGDIFVELDKLEDNSVDIFSDVCSVTHFNHESFTNKVHDLNQWERVSQKIHRPLKKNGHFIVSTDCNVSNTNGEFISPSKIIEYVEKNGFALNGEYKKEYENTDCYIVYNGQKLSVVCLDFIKL